MVSRKSLSGQLALSVLGSKASQWGLVTTRRQENRIKAAKKAKAHLASVQKSKPTQENSASKSIQKNSSALKDSSLTPELTQQSMQKPLGAKERSVKVSMRGSRKNICSNMSKLSRFLLLTVGAALGQSNSPVPPVCPDLSSEYTIYKTVSGYRCDANSLDGRGLTCEPDGAQAAFQQIHPILEETISRYRYTNKTFSNSFFNCSGQLLPRVDNQTCTELEALNWNNNSFKDISCERSSGAVGTNSVIKDCLDVFAWAYNLCSITAPVNVTNPSNSTGEVVTDDSSHSENVGLWVAFGMLSAAQILYDVYLSCQSPNRLAKDSHEKYHAQTDARKRYETPNAKKHWLAEVISTIDNFSTLGLKEKGILLGLSLLGLASGLPFLFYDHENGWQPNNGSLPQNGSNFTDSDYSFNFNSGEPLSQMMTYLLFSGSVILPLLLSFRSTGDGCSPLGTNLTPRDKAVKDDIERTINDANQNWHSLNRNALGGLGCKFSVDNPITRDVARFGLPSLRIFKPVVQNGAFAYFLAITSTPLEKVGASAVYLLLRYFDAYCKCFSLPSAKTNVASQGFKNLKDYLDGFFDRQNPHAAV